MRLVDADKLCEVMDNWAVAEFPTCADGSWEYKMQLHNYKMIREFERLLAEAPTIEVIPVYEQVKWERDVAVEQLRALDIGLGENPYLKAIPVEWIKQWNVKCQNGKLNYWLYDYHEWHEAIVAMLEDWEEENDTAE